MEFQFKKNAKYTLVSISEWMAHTIRQEIIITGFDDKQNREVFRGKGKKKQFYLPKPEEIEKQLVFEGHDLPFVLDSETSRFTGNACFNFVTDEPELLREFIEGKCLNPTPEKFRLIQYTTTKREGPEELTETLLFKKPSNIF